MKMYVVCEDYSNAFYGVFGNKDKADAMAEKVGGYVLQYDLNQPQYDNDGQLLDEE